MKKALVILLQLAAIVANGQDVKGFKSLRYDEDHAYLKDDTNKTWYQKFKYIPIGSNAYSSLSFGGEFRYQAQFYRNEDWGDGPERSYSAYYYRTLVHSDLHLGKSFRLFAQLNSNTAVGRPTGNRPIDENRLDVHQLFFDLSLPGKGPASIVLRAGRQEFLYGSQRIISVREGPNNRLSFDACKLFFKKPDLQIDAFYGAPLQTRFGPFDDPLNANERVWSGYAVLNKVPGIKNLDFYYIGYWNRSKAYYAGMQEEKRHSFGARLWNGEGAFKWDIEALYQLGSFGRQTIKAHTASANLSYAFERARLSPVIGIKTEIISGDKDENDGELNTFNPLFPRGAYFGLAALIGPVNLLDVHPSLQLQLTRNIAVLADYDVFWRQQKGDGIYGPNVMLVYPPAGNNKFIGHQLGLSAEYNPIEQLTIAPELTYFFPGAYLKTVSTGKTVLFAALTMQLKY